MAVEARSCELCFMNPPCDTTEDGEITFLPVPDALPGKDLCADCQQQCDDWDRDLRRHKEENHAAPWTGNNCNQCSMSLYVEDQARAWEEHLARCEECQRSPHDFVEPVPSLCRECGVEADKVPSNEVCTQSYTREMHRDNC